MAALGAQFPRKVLTDVGGLTEPAAAPRAGILVSAVHVTRVEAKSAQC